MKHDAVIFDLFGTLVDNFSFQEHLDVLEEMAKTLSVPSEDFMSLWLYTFDERVKGVYKNPESNIVYICKELGIKLDKQRILKAGKIRRNFTRRTLKPRQDAVKTMEQLKVKGYKIGLITDCSSEVPSYWKDLPFAKLVDVPVFSCLTGLKKPDPRIYKLACNRLGVSPEKCFYVGDGSSYELSGASKVGMKPVLIHTPSEDENDSYQVNPERWYGDKVTGLKEILSLIE
ncbi:MAG: HAD family hydrolase [Thermoplasmata archaeon]|nr:MAG: HAD family hydrolase [Thermoplasmata archaeon]